MMVQDVGHHLVEGGKSILLDCSRVGLVCLFAMNGRDKRVVVGTRTCRSWCGCCAMIYEEIESTEGEKGDTCKESWVGSFDGHERAQSESSHMSHLLQTIMDIRHPLPEHIHILRACYNDDAPDFVALGGDHSVHVYLIVRLRLDVALFPVADPFIFRQYESSATLVASFHVGSRITALAWSSRSVSPSHSDQWIIE